MKSVLVLADAAEDMEDARDFYDELEPGVGSYCVDSLIADIESLGLLHGIHPVHFGCFRMLATRFPFGIYYQDRGATVEVMAVLDLRRDPNWIREEMRRRK